MQKFYPVADVTSLGAAAGSHCYSEEEAASTVTHEPMEDLPAEAVPKAPSTEDDTVTDGQVQSLPTHKLNPLVLTGDSVGMDHSSYGKAVITDENGLDTDGYR